MKNSARILSALLVSVLIASALPAQWVIPSWESTTPVPIDYPVNVFFAAGYHDHIVVLDGVTAWVADVDLATGEVLSWRPTLAPDRSIRAAVLPSGGALVEDYIVLPHEPTSLVGSLNPDGTIDSWTESAGLNTPRLISGIGATTSSGNRIYTAGGHGYGSALNVVEMTTIQSDGSLNPWTVVNSLPAGVILHDPRAEVINGRLYVFGGEGTSPSASLAHSRDVHRAEILADGALGPWEQVGEMLVARPHAGHLVANGTMHVVGGGVHSYMTNAVESAQLGAFGVTSEHVSSAPLPYSPGLNEPATAVVGSWGYVVGGNTRPFGGGNLSAVIVGQVAPLCSFAEGPYVFERERGKPVWEEASWESCGGEGVLQILNHGAASAFVYLNGDLVAGPSDFAPNVEVLEIPVNLAEGPNTVTVQLRSRPGSSLVLDFVE